MLLYCNANSHYFRNFIFVLAVAPESGSHKYPEKEKHEECFGSPRLSINLKRKEDESLITPALPILHC